MDSHWKIITSITPILTHTEFGVTDKKLRSQSILGLFENRSKIISVDKEKWNLFDQYVPGLVLKKQLVSYGYYYSDASINLAVAEIRKFLLEGVCDVR